MSLFFYRRVFRSRNGEMAIGARMPRTWFRQVYAHYRRLRDRADD
ncbi:hypothetical protein [Burkholderia multivorans]|nr:hypothetical protein [Burkholderia multivorans]EED96865.1 hypothetical protein BURMUCGD1_1173 [Burkholderia multivorans CGD1]